MSTHPLLVSPPEAILFDADGTLYDSERLSFEASRLTALDLHGLDVSWEAFDQHVIRGSCNTPEFLESQGLVVDVDKVQTVKSAHYERIIAEELKPIPGLYDLLAWCKEQSIVNVIVSSNRRRTIELSLNALDIGGFFQGLVAYEDTPDRRKPDPRAYQLGLQLAGVAASEALAFEDTAKGIASARAADLRCIGVSNSTNSEADLAKADLVIDSYHQLLSGVFA
jgi:HAD superfamily hydrolase (TIGR01509 family)